MTRHEAERGAAPSDVRSFLPALPRTILWDTGSTADHGTAIMLVRNGVSRLGRLPRMRNR